jgi:HD-like signal output (HDOD) protein/methylmalonyl-CoA mutase cobalamin-binding subunit
MPSILIISDNRKEKDILLNAFAAIGFEVLESRVNRVSYVAAVQFKPDVMLVRFPAQYPEYLRFCKNINSRKGIDVVIIGYGPPVPVQEFYSFKTSGVRKYFTTPLKFSSVLNYVKETFSRTNPDKIVWDAPPQTSEGTGYITQLFHNTLPVKKINLIIDRIDSVMAFPFVVIRVIKITDDPEKGARELAFAIKSDPVISSKILKVSNSVFFAPRSGKPIATIKDAIIRIGFTETKNISLSIAVMEALTTKTASLGFNRRRFWLYSLGVAVTSHLISQRMKTVSGAVAFLAGSLHSFGILLLDEFFPELLKKYLLTASENAQSFYTAEKTTTGITHFDFTRELFRKWHLPADIYECIGYLSQFEEHGGVFNPAENENSPAFRYAVTVYAARMIIKACSFGSEADQYVSPLSVETLQLLELKEHMISRDFIEKIKSQLLFYSRFLIVASPFQDVLALRELNIVIYRTDFTVLFPVVVYFYSKGITPVFVSSIDHTDHHPCDIFIYCTMDKISSRQREEVNHCLQEAGLNQNKIIPRILFQGSVEHSNGGDEWHIFPNAFDIRQLDALMIELGYAE